MRPMKKIIASMSLALGCVACGPSLTMAGAGVKIGSADSVANCQVMGAVEATAGNQERAETMIRNNAGKLNAEVVVITDTTENGGKVRLEGKAYNCPSS
jgi:hypothetical protein